MRQFHMIRHFAEQGHKVTVCSLTRSAAEADAGRGLADHCHAYFASPVSNGFQTLRMVARLPTLQPSSFGFFYSRQMQQAVNEVLARAKFDLIFVYCSSVAPYVEHVHHIPKLLDFGDMDSQKWLEYAQYKPFPLSMGYWLEGHKLVRAEKRLAQSFDMCAATTAAEIKTLKSFGVPVEADWFPNGVDSDYFKPEGQLGADDYDADTLSFIGRMDYYPNQECMIEFCAHVLPLIQSERPDAKLLIVGAEPSLAIKRLENIRGVTVTGSVPDVRPYVRRSAAMIAPLNIARGTQNKILEAMAMGVPVITSEIAAGGVDAEREKQFLVANTPEGYARASLRIMNSAAERQRLAIAGRERMLSHHSWPAAMHKLDEIVGRCVALHAGND